MKNRSRGIKRFLSIFVISIMGVWGSVAQTVNFEVEAPLSVREGQRFQVALKLNNAKGSDFIAPQFDGLRVLNGPSIGNVFNYSNIGGVATNTQSEVYTFFVEADGSKSVATVGVASIVANGKTYKTKAQSIQVGGGGAQAGGGGQASGQRAAGAAGGGSRATQSQQTTQQSSLLRLELSKTNVYQGEGIGVELVLYTSVSVSPRSNPVYPTFKGFWVVDLDVPQNQTMERRTIDGVVYYAQVIRRWLLFPQQSGTLEIEPATFEVLEQHIVSAGRQSIYDQFFGGGSSVSQVAVNLSTGVRKITVKPLPKANKPVGMDIAVGNFTLTSEFKSDTMQVNRAGTLIVRLEGEGDFPLIEPPYFRLPPEFESYDVKTTDKIRNTVQGSRGVRTWEFPFVARSEGEYTVQSVDVAYFNPRSGEYSVLKTPEYRVVVERGDGNTASAGGTMGSLMGVSKEELEILNQDIRYISLEGLVGKSGGVLYSGRFFVILLLILVVAGAGFVLIGVRSNRVVDSARVRSRGANKMAVRRLKSAHRELQRGDTDRFYAEVLVAVWGFLGDRFGLEASELNKGKVRQELEMRGMGGDVADGFVGLLEECEMAKYGMGVVDSRGMQAVYDRALGLLF